MQILWNYMLCPLWLCICLFFLFIIFSPLSQIINSRNIVRYLPSYRSPKMSKMLCHMWENNSLEVPKSLLSYLSKVFSLFKYPNLEYDNTYSSSSAIGCWALASNNENYFFTVVVLLTPFPLLNIQISDITVFQLTKCYSSSDNRWAIIFLLYQILIADMKESKQSKSLTLSVSEWLV